jgi:hypothetical protein
MKKLIRLTESDLHKIVKESVKKILSEAGMPYGGEFYMKHPSNEYSLYFNKGIRDSQNAKDKESGKYPNPYNGWMKRVNNGDGSWSDADFNHEDWHMYDDDDASLTASRLQQYDPNGAYHWDMFRKHHNPTKQLPTQP